MMPDPAQHNPTGQPGATRAALLGLCPGCGEKTLFDGVIQFADKCPKCGLDFARFNVGDGPAAFLTLIIGALVATMAAVLEVKLSPPFWVHAVLWIPITSGAVVLGLRAAKAALLGAEYRRNAGEGRAESKVDEQ